MEDEKTSLKEELETLTQKELNQLKNSHQEWVRQGKRGDGQLRLKNVNLDGLNISSLELEGAILENVSLVGTNLRGTRLNKSIIKHVNFSNSFLTEVEFKESELEDVTFANSECSKADFQTSKMNEVKISNCDLSGSKFINADVSSCEFVSSNFRQTDSRNLIGNGTCFTDSNFEQARFSSANLKDSKFLQTNLRSADLYRTDLIAANFEGADLRGVSFIEANLEEVNLLSSITDHKTNFKDVKEVKGCQIDKYNIDCLDDNKGGLQLSQLLLMDIRNDIATMRESFSGYWRMTHAFSLFIFIFPYVFFLFKCWSISHGLDLFVGPTEWLTQEEVPLVIERLWEFFYSAGNLDGNVSGWVIVSGILIVYNLFRLALLYKTLTLEHQEVITGLPVKFTMNNSFSYKWFWDWEVPWEFIYKVVKYGIYVNLFLAFVHFMMFLWRPVLIL